MNRRNLRFRTPPRRWRAAALAFTLALPGALAGGIVAMFVGSPTVCIAAGLLLGVFCGAWLEAHPPSS